MPVRHGLALAALLLAHSYFDIAALSGGDDGARAPKLHSETASSEEFFEKRIRPVLAENCFRCHGGQKTSGGLRVDSRASLIAGGESGPAIEPGAPLASLLLRAVTRDDDVSAMPPDRALEKRQVDDLRAWIDAGAPWPARSEKFTYTKHWAFEPVSKPPEPAVRDVTWPNNTIDRFILARLEATGRRPSPPADRRSLLRRASYNLTGLPPSPEEIAAFQNDDSPCAFETAIERLLDSRHYGEHWGRHWFDVVRYADTAGENTDRPLPHAWRYRNWVIDSLNADMPYDQFIREQLAGDTLASDLAGAERENAIIATGYLAIARRFGHDIDKDIHLTHEDIIDNLGKTFLGLSLGCCRCHDHKFDPLTTRDYYGLYGIFASTKISYPGCEPKQQPRDLVPLWTRDQIEQRTRPTVDLLASIERAIEEEETHLKKLVQRWRDTAGARIQVLSSGEIADGSSSFLFPDVASHATTGMSNGTGGAAGIQVAVHRGEILRLSVSPNGNHGADTTRVELRIATEDGESAWDVGDLIDIVADENPLGDRYGNARAWCFLDGRDGPSFLQERLTQIDGRTELRGWRNGDTPSVFVNRSEEPVTVWTTLPPRSFFVHPGPHGPVAVAWISPVDGIVSIRGRIADAHPGGDGVGWRLEHFASPSLGESLARIQHAGREIADLHHRRNELAAKQVVIPVAYAAVEGEISNARIQIRGEPEDLGEEVPRKFPDFLGGAVVASTTTSGRRELADWIADPKNPLTARVIVNRVWQWHFGKGLVASANDFGTRGIPPTHPELLDYLAVTFIESGWRLKDLHRLILGSATWRQASTSMEAASIHAAFPRRPLTAEELRDTLLLASGELDDSPGGEHPFPPENTWQFTQHSPFAAEYDTNRRSVYLMQKRNRRNRFFALFDGPDPNSSTAIRDVTTVPTQALFFLNDPFVHDRAENFAARVFSSSTSDRARLDVAMELLFGRPASAEEHADAASFFHGYQSLCDPGMDPGFSREAWKAYARILLSSNEVLYVD